MHVLGGTRRHQKYFLSILALMFVGICRAGEAPAMSGAELYREFCASCHGVKGHGNGPVASSLRQKVPDLTLIAKRRGGSFPAEEIHRIVDGRLIPRAHGSAETPVWGWELYGFAS
jgi:mono/diheme cytochrome c family protein